MWPRADQQGSCADAAGEFLWSGWRFKTISADLERVWAKIAEGAGVTVVLEPTGMSLASVMGPPFRHWDGTTSGATSVDMAMMDDAVVEGQAPPS